MVHGKYQSAPIGLINQPLCLLRGGRNRLFDEDMLAGLERAHRELEVAGDRRRDGDRIDTRIVQDVAEVVRDLDCGVAALDAGEALLPEIADRDEPPTGRIPEFSYEIRTPVAISDDRYANHVMLLLNTPCGFHARAGAS